MNKIKKVCLVIGSLTTGGAERVVVTLANSFILKKIEVTIMCIGKEEIESIYDLDNKINLMNIVSGYSYNIFLRKIKQFKKMQNYISDNRPDVIISFLDYINIQVLFSLKKFGIPIIISIRNDPMHSNSKLVKIFCDLLYSKANAAVFQTKEQQSFFKNSDKRLDTIIMNPLRKEIEYAKTIKYKDVVVNICSIGRLTKQKNHKLLINAFYNIAHKFPQIKLNIYGEGEESVLLEGIIESKGLKNKVFMHGISKDIVEVLGETDIFVLCSNFEGVPNVLIEAMCMGVPCIATEFNGGGAKMLIENEVNGLLIPRDDIEVLSYAIERLIKDVLLRKRLGENSIKIREKVNENNISDQWLKFLNEL